MIHPDRIGRLVLAGRQTPGPGFPAWLATPRETRELLARGWLRVKVDGAYRLHNPNTPAFPKPAPNGAHTKG